MGQETELTGRSPFRRRRSVMDWSGFLGEDDDDVPAFRGTMLLPSLGLFQHSPGNERKKLEQKFGTHVSVLMTPTPEESRLH